MENFLPEDNVNLREDTVSFDDLKKQEVEMKSMIDSYAAEKRERPNSLYVIFENENDKEKALKLVEEYRQIDDAFTFLRDDFGVDSGNNLGIALNFQKTPEKYEDIVKDFFTRQNIHIKETYPVDKDGIRVVGTKESNVEEFKRKDNIIPFPSKPEETTPSKFKKAA